MSEISVGNVVEGTVDGLAGFGAFVKLSDGRKGLVHISEVASGYVEDVHDVLHDGDQVKVKILSIDGERIRLSIKRAAADYVERPRRDRGDRPFSDRGRGDRRDDRRGGRRGGDRRAFEDKLAQFMKDSNARQADVRSNLDGKQGRAGFNRRGRS